VTTSEPTQLRRLAPFYSIKELWAREFKALQPNKPDFVIWSVSKTMEVI